jgi:hypothetical protein
MRPLVLAVALAAPVSLLAQARELTLLEYHVTPPATWAPRAPSSTSRLAEFTVPPTPDGSGEIVAYFFGPQQQPNVDANLARWKGQFSHPDGSPVVESVARDSSGAFPIVFADTVEGAILPS